MTGWDNSAADAWDGGVVAAVDDAGSSAVHNDVVDGGAEQNDFANGDHETIVGNNGGMESSGMECFKCGGIGHMKMDCPNEPKPFTGACRICSVEGHRAFECHDKPPQVCKHCNEEGHLAAECENPRYLDFAGVPSHTVEEAWAMLKSASKERDIEDFKDAIQIYSKADRLATYEDLEKKFREANFTIYTVCMEREHFKTTTLVDLQGIPDRKYSITYQYSLKPTRARNQEEWPASSDENAERITNAGEPMPRMIPMCWNCDELGHTSKNCKEEKRVREENDNDVCINCEVKGHRLRDCPEPRKPRNVCKNCEQPGHKAVDCDQPRSAKNVECRSCGQTGHFQADCPDRAERGPTGCHNCGSEEHKARECSEPIDMARQKCRNCDEMGHQSRQCPQPRDYSRVKCQNCGQMGHTKVRCKEPVEETPVDVEEMADENVPLKVEGDGDWAKAEVSGGNEW